MSPEFIALSENETAAGALERVRSSEIAPETLTTILLSDAEGKLSGSIAVVTLLARRRAGDAGEPREHEPVSCTPTPTCPRSRAR